MSLIIQGAREVMLFYACKSREGLQRVLDSVGSMYAACIFRASMSSYVYTGIWSPRWGDCISWRSASQVFITVLIWHSIDWH